MPRQKRHKTDYRGVYYIVGTSVNTGKSERIYYIVYRKDGKKIEEKAGRQYQDKMTAAKASLKRSNRIQGKALSNTAKREKAEAEKIAQEGRWTIDRLWKEYKKQNPHLKGWKTYISQYDLHIKPSFENKEPSEILPLDVDRLRLKLLKKRSPQTASHVLKLLKRVVKFGSEHGLCSNFSFVFKMPTVDNQKTEDLTEKQLKKLMKAIAADDHAQAGPMMLMALYTGMRRGEMFKLKWKDIDFERGFIHIRDPKGGPDQVIPLNEPARGLLKSHPKTSKYVFPGRGGRRRVNIGKAVNKIKTAAGLPKGFRPLHGLRHVYASAMASSGKVDMYTLQKLLTHKDPMMTQRYAHLRDDALKRAADVAGDIFKEVAASSNNKK
jgi:integrase